MAIAQIGATQAGTAINGGNVTLTFNVAPISNDVVIVYGGGAFTASTPSISTTGYTQILSTQTTGSYKFGVWRKVMGATPDTTVVCVGSGNAADVTAYGSIVLRGVDPVTPEDTTISTANGSGVPDCTTITTRTNNAVVIACAINGVNDSTVGTPANYSVPVAAAANDTNPCSVAGCLRTIAAAGSENPASFASWTSATNIVATVAIRALGDSFGTVVATGSNTNASIPASFATSAGLGPAAVGDLIFVLVCEGSVSTPTVTGVTDNLGNVYTGLALASDTTGSAKPFYSVVTVPGTITPTSTNTASSNDGVILAALYRGPFSPVVDINQTCTNDATSPYAGPATGTLTQPIELLVGYFINDQPFSDNYTSPTPSSRLDVQGHTGSSGIQACILSLSVTATTTITFGISTGASRAGSQNVATFMHAGKQQICNSNQALTRASFW